jgi:hypothetical protein
MHIGWVPDDSGSAYHAQMAVLVKPNGRFGRAYMAAIRPFRYALVYPLLLRAIGRGWQARASADALEGGRFTNCSAALASREPRTRGRDERSL